MKIKTALKYILPAAVLLFALFSISRPIKAFIADDGAEDAQARIEYLSMIIDIDDIRFMYQYSYGSFWDDDTVCVSEYMLNPNPVSKDGPYGVSLLTLMGDSDVVKYRRDYAMELLPAELENQLLVSDASSSDEGMDERVFFCTSEGDYYLSLDDDTMLKESLYSYFKHNILDKDGTYGQQFVPAALPEIYSGAQLSGERCYVWHIYTRADEHVNLFWGGDTVGEGWVQRAVFAFPYYSAHTAVVENNCMAQLIALIDELIAENSPSLFFDDGSVNRSLHENVAVGETVIFVEEMPNSEGEYCTLRIKLDTEKTREMAEWLMHTVDYYTMAAEHPNLFS